MRNVHYYVIGLVFAIIAFGLYLYIDNSENFKTPLQDSHLSISPTVAPNNQKAGEFKSLSANRDDSDQADDFDSDINPDPNKPRDVEARRLLKVYERRFIGSGMDGRKLLDAIYVLKLEKNNENLRLVQKLINERITIGEKVALTRIVASFYSPYNVLGANDYILANLRDVINSGNVDLGRAGGLAYSRLGYLPDSLDILAFIRSNGYINDDEYYGDLVYLLQAAPKTVQSKIIDQISAGDNGFSIDVLISTIQKSEDVLNLSHDASEKIGIVISKHQPVFPEDVNQFGLMDAIRYASWVQSMALLNNVGTTNGYNQYIAKTLGGATSDPRWIISFLISSEGQDWVGSVGSTEVSTYMFSKIEQYAARNAANGVIRDSVKEIRGKFGKRAN